MSEPWVVAGLLGKAVGQALDRGLFVQADVRFAIAGTSILSLHIRAALASFKALARHAGLGSWFSRAPVAPSPLPRRVDVQAAHRSGPPRWPHRPERLAGRPSRPLPARPLPAALPGANPFVAVPVPSSRGWGAYACRPAA